MISARIEVLMMEAAVDYTMRQGKSNAGQIHAGKMQDKIQAVWLRSLLYGAGWAVFSASGTG